MIEIDPYDRVGAALPHQSAFCRPLTVRVRTTAGTMGNHCLGSKVGEPSAQCPASLERDLVQRPLSCPLTQRQRNVDRPRDKRAVCFVLRRSSPICSFVLSSLRRVCAIVVFLSVQRFTLGGAFVGGEVFGFGAFVA